MNAQHHSTLGQVHASFLNAGSHAVTTNSYGVIPGVGFNAADRAKLIDLAGKIARQAVQSSKPGSFVLGSLGPLVESYRADLIKEHAGGVSDYRIACKALAPYVDAFLAETMSCIDESTQVVEAVSEFDSCLPMLVSYTLDPNGNFRDTESVTRGLRRFLDLVKKKNVQLLAILFNCSEPEAMTLALAKIAADPELVKCLDESKVVLGAYANRLTQVDPNWTLKESTMPQPFRTDLDEKHYWDDFIQLWINKMNVKVVGGCCGITPEHIAYISAELNKRKQK